MQDVVWHRFLAVYGLLALSAFVHSCTVVMF